MKHPIPILTREVIKAAREYIRLRENPMRKPRISFYEWAHKKGFMMSFGRGTEGMKKDYLQSTTRFAEGIAHCGIELYCCSQKISRLLKNEVPDFEFINRQSAQVTEANLLLLASLKVGDTFCAYLPHITAKLIRQTTGLLCATVIKHVPGEITFEFAFVHQEHEGTKHDIVQLQKPWMIVTRGCFGFDPRTPADFRHISELQADYVNISGLDMNSEEYKEKRRTEARAEDFTRLGFFTMLFCLNPFIEQEVKEAKLMRGRHKVNGKSAKRQVDDVIYVGADWETELYYKRNSKARGHWKQQAFGPGWQQHRTIYIKEYKKGDFRRKSGKERAADKIKRMKRGTRVKNGKIIKLKR